MKNLTEFLIESSNNSQFVNIIKSVLSANVIKNFNPYNGEHDPNRFIAQDNNAKTICDLINNTGKAKALTVKEYYEVITGKNPNNLSVQALSQFDAQNGDIIFVDDDNKPICKIDLKVSERYLGSISLGSIINFDKDGLYLCCNCSNGNYKIVSHKDIEKLANKGFLNAPDPRKNYKGKSVTFNGQQMTDEYYIRGIDINNM